MGNWTRSGPTTVDPGTPSSASVRGRPAYHGTAATRAQAFGQVDLSSRRGCLGRIYFQVPGGIQHGQHWLNVQFEKSLVRVPFRILTEEEEKKLSKSWKDIKKEHEKAFKK